MHFRKLKKIVNRFKKANKGGFVICFWFCYLRCIIYIFPDHMVNISARLLDRIIKNANIDIAFLDLLRSYINYGARS